MHRDTGNAQQGEAVARTAGVCMSRHTAKLLWTDSMVQSTHPVPVPTQNVIFTKSSYYIRGGGKREHAQHFISNEGRRHSYTLFDNDVV